MQQSGAAAMHLARSNHRRYSSAAAKIRRAARSIS
jgi:hypothetical protein